MNLCRSVFCNIICKFPNGGESFIYAYKFGHLLVRGGSRQVVWKREILDEDGVKTVDQQLQLVGIGWLLRHRLKSQRVVLHNFRITYLEHPSELHFCTYRILGIIKLKTEHNTTIHYLNSISVTIRIRNEKSIYKNRCHA